jgi:hypothetical protein
MATPKKKERKRNGGQESLQCIMITMKASPGLQDGWSTALGRKAWAATLAELQDSKVLHLTAS